MKTRSICNLVARTGLIILCFAATVSAQALSPEEEAARKAADPLGNVKAIMMVFQSGDFMDLSVGAYPLVVRPDGAPSWQLKLGVSYFFN